MRLWKNPRVRPSYIFQSHIFTRLRCSLAQSSDLVALVNAQKNTTIITDLLQISKFVFLHLKERLEKRNSSLRCQCGVIERVVQAVFFPQLPCNYHVHIAPSGTHKHFAVSLQ